MATQGCILIVPTFVEGLKQAPTGGEGCPPWRRTGATFLPLFQAGRPLVSARRAMLFQTFPHFRASASVHTGLPGSLGVDRLQRRGSRAPNIGVLVLEGIDEGRHGRLRLPADLSQRLGGSAANGGGPVPEGVAQ